MECELNGFYYQNGYAYSNTCILDWDADIFIVAFWFDEPHLDYNDIICTWKTYGVTSKYCICMQQLLK